ncbi:MAG: ABC transporter ATP-binding protein [Caulobacteraceae bacterium]
MDLIAQGLSSAVLNDCHLIVSAGEIVSLRGPSGSGKTLLLRAIADLDPHEGKVSLNGVARSAMTGPEWRRRVRFVAAEAAWWADRVGEHFRAPDKAGVMAMEVGLPHGCMHWQVARLSTGEKQRLHFLRAVEDRPNVLLLDEPTAALDRAAERAVETLIKRLRAGGAAIVLVTHSDSQAGRLAQRRYVIENGRLREKA